MILGKMEYTWHMDNSSTQDSGSARNSARNHQGRNQGPGLLIDELEAYMAPVGESCGSYSNPQPVTDVTHQRRAGGHQLPESPPDSGSENPYSPTENQVPQAIAVSHEPYLLVHDHIAQELIQQNGDYNIYEELKPDGMNDVVVLHSDQSLIDARSIGLNDPYRYGMRVEMSDIEGQNMLLNSQLVTLGHESLTPVYTSLQTESGGKKRKLSQDVNSQVKCEPDPSLSPHQTSSRPVQAPPSVDGSEAGDDSPFQCIRFSIFQQSVWQSLYDLNFKILPSPSYIVGADKGFNYSQIDEAFVCQKKNHFQVTCQIQIQGEPVYLRTTDGFKEINSFYIHFYGVKAEDPSQEVRVEQSQSDRTKKPFHPVPVDIRRETTKITVGRLHFAETTNNNMRKKGRPNPDQRHFQLVVALKAHCGQNEYIIAAQASDRIIVRASNPGQFESDCTENWWQRGISDNSVYFNGKVGVNTDRPDEACVVNGNLKVTGNIVYPSDARAKHNIQELDTAQQLKNVQSLRVVKFNYDTSFAKHSGLLGFDPSMSTPHVDTGVIAQEVRQVIPEAVKEAGDVTLPNGDTIQNFLVVNKDRIFMENLGAVKELCKVTGNLESRVNHLEKLNKKLCKINLQRRDSNRSSVSSDSRNSCPSTTSSKSIYSDGNLSIDPIRDIARNIRKHEFCQKFSHKSPKYHRKPCRDCKTNEYIKHQLNKNMEHNKKRNNLNENLLNAIINKDSMLQDEINKFDSLPSGKIETRVWMKNNEESIRDFEYNNTGLPFCCKSKNITNASNELVSNKILQIIITVLIFVMAICLVVMSALYFVEHRELLSMHERIRLQENYSNFGKSINFGSSGPWVKPTTVSYADANRVKQMANSKTNYNSQQSKKESKGIHNGKDHITTASPIVDKVMPTLTTLPLIPLHGSLLKMKEIVEQKNYVHDQTGNRCNNQPYTSFKEADPIGQVSRECSFGRIKIDLKDDVDIECQSSCNLDPSQAYDNQEPIENHPEKEVNDTLNQQLIENPLKLKQVIIPPIPERNASENSVIVKNEVISKSQDEENASLNFLHIDPNSTEDDISSKVKRNNVNRFKRSSSEELLYQRSECPDEDDVPKVAFGIKSKTYFNDTMFTERICAPDFMNFTYHVPISKCLKEKQIGLSFKSSKIKELKLCNYDNKICEVDNKVNCDKEILPIEDSQDLWVIKMSMECNVNKIVKLRAAFIQQRVQDLCLLPPDKKLGFVEYNIQLSRKC